MNSSYGLLGQLLLFSGQYKRKESHSRGQSSRWEERPTCSVCLWLVLPNSHLTFNSRLLGGNVLCPDCMEFPSQKVYTPVGCTWVYVPSTHWHRTQSRSATRRRRGEDRQRYVEGCLRSGWRGIRGAGISFFMRAFGVCAPSCSFMWLLFSSFSLDWDETEWDSALFLFHPPRHTPASDVGLAINITLSHPAVVSKEWRKRVRCRDTVCREVGSLLCPPERQPLSGIHPLERVWLFEHEVGPDDLPAEIQLRSVIPWWLLGGEKKPHH